MKEAEMNLIDFKKARIGTSFLFASEPCQPG